MADGHGGEPRRPPREQHVDRSEQEHVQRDSELSLQREDLRGELSREHARTARSGHGHDLWTHRARQVIGIEPLDEMRHTAEAATTASHVHFQGGFAQHTGLPEGAADIVTCAQALHWMEPDSTLAEVARILRPGGVFAAYDYEWPPTVHWEAERAFYRWFARVQELQQRYGITGPQQWAKSEHLVRLLKARVLQKQSA